MIGFGDNPLKFIHEYESAKEARNKSDSIYTRRTIIKEFEILNSLLNTELQSNLDMGNYIPLLESQYSRLNAMGMKVEEQMRINIIINSLANDKDYSASVASLYTLNEKKATWEYVAVIFILEQKRLQPNEGSKLVRSSGANGK